MKDYSNNQKNRFRNSRIKYTSYGAKLIVKKCPIASLNVGLLFPAIKKKLIKKSKGYLSKVAQTLFFNESRATYIRKYISRYDDRGCERYTSCGTMRYNIKKLAVNVGIIHTLFLI